MYLFYLFFLLPGSVFNRSELSFQRAGRQSACTEKQTHTELSRSSHAMRRKNNEQQPRHLDRSRQQNERNIYRADRSIYRPPVCVWSLCLGAHTYPVQPVVFSQGRLERGHQAISAQSPTIIKHRVLFHRGNPPHQAPLLGRKSPFCLTLSTLMRRVLCLSNRSNQFMSKRIVCDLCSFNRVALHMGRHVPNAENLKQRVDLLP